MSRTRTTDSTPFEVETSCDYLDGAAVRGIAQCDSCERGVFFDVWGLEIERDGEWTEPTAEEAEDIRLALIEAAESDYYQGPCEPF